MAFWQNAGNALRAGWTAYRESALTPGPDGDWDDFFARVSRYRIYEAYQYNTIYTGLNTYSQSMKAKNRLYNRIRGIYNPVARQNRLITNNVYKGLIDYEHMTRGALPFVTDNKGLFDPLKKVMRWSRLGQQLSLYTSNAALLGDSAIWVNDDPDRQRIRLEVIHPAKIKQLVFDEVGNIKAAVLEYDQGEEFDIKTLRPDRGPLSWWSPNAKRHKFTLVATQDRFETYEDGYPLDAWDNDYGFVPLILANYEPSNDSHFGRNSFFNALSKINYINDQAALISDQVRNIVVPMLQALRTRKEEMDRAQSEDRDVVKILYMPKEGQELKPITMTLDINGALANLKEQIRELYYDMPELALQTIRENSVALTEPGVRTGYSDAIGGIENCRKNLDPGIVSALLMGVTIGAVRGYDEFKGFTRDSFDRGEMELSLAERAVISDTLSREERITAYQTAASVPRPYARFILRELEIPDEDIEKALDEADEAEQATLDATDPQGQNPGGVDDATAAGVAEDLDAIGMGKELDKIANGKSKSKGSSAS